MADVLVQTLLSILLLICCTLTIQRSGKWFNPVTIISVVFFVPLVFATFRLSGLQAHSWSTETYTAIWLIVGSWLILPTIVIVALGQPNIALHQDRIVDRSFFLLLTRASSLVVIAAYLLSNYIQAGTIIPITIPEVAYRLHTDFPPGLRLFARCIPAIVGLSYVMYIRRRQKFELLLLGLALVVPLSRLSRIDVALSLVILVALFMYMPLFKLTIRRVTTALILFIGLSIGAVELGNQRTNRFGLYEVNYSQAIKWRPDTVGPAGIFAVLYGYFPLSFENFDEFVSHAKDKRTYGSSSFDWFLTGFVKMNRFTGGLHADDAFQTFRPVSSAANVPTAMLPFYSDFGLIGMIFPALVYFMLWLFLFYRSATTHQYLMWYAIYTAAFALSSFQALMVSPMIFHQLLMVFLIWTFFKLTDKSSGTKNTV